MLENGLMVKVFALCIIVWSSGTNGDRNEKFLHEQAHCWGWKHPAKASAFGKAFVVPEKYRKLGEYPNWTTPCAKWGCSTTKAKRLCDGHFACAEGGMLK